MIADGRQSIYDAPWTLIAPVLAIFVTVAGFNLLGDGLRRSLDVGWSRAGRRGARMSLLVARGLQVGARRTCR